MEWGLVLSPYCFLRIKNMPLPQPSQGLSVSGMIKHSLRGDTSIQKVFDGEEVEYNEVFHVMEVCEQLQRRLKEVEKSLKHDSRQP